MLTFETIEKTEDYTRYAFYPEGDKRPGMIDVFSDGHIEVVSESEDDVNSRYLKHAITAIPKMDTDKGTVAWC